MIFLAVGDSLTFEAVPLDSTYRRPWPAYVGDNLAVDHPEAPVEVINEGIAGTSTFQWLTYAGLYVTPHSPDVVAICLGMNDAAGVPIPQPSYESQLRTIIDIIQTGTPGVKIILMTTPQVREGQAGTNRTNPSLGLYADVVRALAIDLGLPLADIYAAFDALIEDPSHTDLFVADGVHLSDAGVAVFTGAAYPVVESVLFPPAAVGFIDIIASGIPSAIPYYSDPGSGNRNAPGILVGGTYYPLDLTIPGFQFTRNGVKL